MGYANEQAWRDDQLCVCGHKNVSHATPPNGDIGDGSCGFCDDCDMFFRAGDVKFPEIHVQLSGESDNAFFIASRVRKALQNEGYDEAGKLFFDEALSGDYQHLLTTATKWVSVH